MGFKRDEYHVLCIWKFLRNKWPLDAAVRICYSKDVYLKISQISQVLFREICEMFTLLQNNSRGCFLTQLLLQRKMHFSEIPRGIRLINWLTFICMLDEFLYSTCNSLFKSHRSGHEWCSIKKAFRNTHRKAPLFLTKKEAY